MSIFTRIKTAIFGPEHAQVSPTGKPQVSRAPTPTSPIPTNAPTGAGIPASPADAQWGRRADGLSPAAAQASGASSKPVDVEATLTDLSARNPQKLNWRTSIVDLMKLLDIDSSLENRKSLAKELGYTDDTSDSAKMNVWLHKRVMQELASHGGVVPASLVA